MSDKKYSYLIALIIILILAVFSEKVFAQGLSGIHWNGWGVRTGLSSDPDQVYGGIHFNLGEFAKDVRFRPSMELGFGDDLVLVQMLAEVHYVFSNVQVWKPYLGGGLGLTYVNYDNGHFGDDSETDVSLNPIGGIETMLNQGIKFFFELKLGLADDDPDIKFGIGLSWK
jgi:opacity protein-like surface antigen